MLSDPKRFQLSPDAISAITGEMLTVGDAGPGPRRLIRFVAGDAVRKDPFTTKEKTKYADLIEGSRSSKRGVRCLKFGWLQRSTQCRIDASALRCNSAETAVQHVRTSFDSLLAG